MIDTSKNSNPQIDPMSYSATIALAKIAGKMESSGMAKLSISIDSYGENLCISLDDRYLHGEAADGPFRHGMSLSKYIEKFYDDQLSEVCKKIEVDENGTVEFDFTLNKDKGCWGLAVKTTKEVNNSTPNSDTLDLSECEETEHEVLRVIVDKLKEHGIDEICYTFTGGGDSGDLDELQAPDAFTQIKNDLVVTPAGNKDRLITMVKLFVMEYAQAAGNWWDNDGGRGSITIKSNGVCEREVEFYENEQAPDMEETEIPTAFEIKFKAPIQSKTHDDVELKA